MTFCDLVVYVDDGETTATTIGAATALADQFGARLSGLYVVPPAHVPVYSGIEAAVSSVAIEQMDQWLHEREAAAEAAFGDCIRAWGKDAAWISLDGDRVSKTMAQARNYDLLVIGQVDPENDNNEDRSTVDRLVIGLGRPIVLIPHGYSGKMLGKRVLVAWDGKREAARAVHDALPVLKQAEAVDIVSVNAPRDIDIPCADIAAHLSRHGVNVETEKAYSYSNAVGEQLLSLASTYGADMMVMGAYGHSRFRELVLGGATRDILDKTTIPVLMTH